MANTKRVIAPDDTSNTKRVATSGGGDSADPWGGSWGSSWGSAWLALVGAVASPIADITKRVAGSLGINVTARVSGTASDLKIKRIDGSATPLNTPRVDMPEDPVVVPVVVVFAPRLGAVGEFAIGQQSRAGV